MARLIDISLPVSADLPVWPGDPAISIEPAKRIARGDAANVSLLAMGNHTGTHVDPPSHFIDGGRSIDQLDPVALLGPAWVVDLPEARGEVGAAELESARVPLHAERLLIKTPNSGTLGPGKSFREDFCSLSPSTLPSGAWIEGFGWSASITSPSSDGTPPRNIPSIERSSWPEWSSWRASTCPRCPPARAS